ncbi:MAG TPA: malto-oligosyltrehalose trehalohydrolase [Gemmatimonadaceae bacterium]|nr:malto-oligosyltrehalose trehalohydrolase [Gemmatimonadaceae bacterium]
MANPTTAISPTLPAWRHYPIGVEIGPDEVVHARVWAPARSVVCFVELDRAGRELQLSELEPEGNGYFSGVVGTHGAGSRYKLRLDGIGDFPDPVSRFQPDGPHGPSEIIDARGFSWTDGGWSGPKLSGALIYELHIGTFTSAGSYAAAAKHLGDLVDIGVSIIEIMPVAEFPGRFGWGYDGVSLFAPSHLYGAPGDLRAFVDAAHAHGIGVILDVVYNHLGPDGNYLKEFSKNYFKGNTEWGEALNFDGDDSTAVREFFLTNAAYWIDEFHLDGLRLDATQQIFDSSSPNIIAAIGERVRETARARTTIVVAENEPQRAPLLRRGTAGGYELDALWNDDFHHAAMVALTGRDEAYYSGYRGTAQEFVSSAKYGFLYQGQWYRWQNNRRGTLAFDIEPARFINFIQNHDQVANSAFGVRVHQLTSPSRYRALMTLLLLLPQTPMLFQGQEFLASAPFLYFADHNPNLATLVRRGRAEFLGQFAHVATPEITARLADPSSETAFARCKLDWSERNDESRAGALALVRDLVRLRRMDETLRRQGVNDPENHDSGLLARALDGSVLGERAFVLRLFGERRELDRLIAVNLGQRLQAEPLADPLIAAPNRMVWRTMWSSEDPVYGGCGTPPLDSDEGAWILPAESTVLLAPVFADGASRAPQQPTTEKDARAQWKARYETTAR